MVITIAWWWIIQLVMCAIILYTTYKAVFHKSKFYRILTLLLFILSIISPIKIEQPTTINQQYQTDTVRKVKAKIVDNSFEKSTNIQGITKRDLK